MKARVSVDDFNDVVGKIRECMGRSGDFTIGDKAVKDADPALLMPTEETLLEHWQTYQGAIAYYGHLLNRAKEALKESEEELQRTILKNHGCLYEAARSKYHISRPSREDVIVIGVLEGTEDMEQLRQNVKYWRSTVDDLETWTKSWEKKSFVLNGMTHTFVGEKRALQQPPQAPF